jgi:DNA-binding SARP family transcriptional activator
MLGSFEIIVGENHFDLSLNKTEKGWMIAKYLLYHKNRAVSSVELIEVLWPDSKRGAYENALKTGVSRTRAFFTKIDPSLKRLIMTGDAAYFINPDVTVEVDVLRFQAIGDRLAGMNQLTEESRADFSEFLSLYRGAFLVADGRDRIPWIVLQRDMLANLYLSTLYHYLDLLQQDGDDETLLGVCRDALEIVNYDERLQEMMMGALLRTRRGVEASLHSRRDRAGAKGAEHMAEGVQSYYRKINQLNRALENDIDKIREDLAESARKSGAFFCEYNFFKDIQYIQKRHLERLGASLFIALLALDGGDEGQADRLALDESMEVLKGILMENLRVGDTVAQHGAGQYVALLPTVNDATGEMIMRRVVAAYEKKKPHAEIRCAYSVSPILF